MGLLREHVAANVKATRERQGLTRKEAAGVLGLRPDYLAAIERGERNLTLRSIERIADGLGVDVYCLVAENEGVTAERAQRGEGGSPMAGVRGRRAPAGRGR